MYLCFNNREEQEKLNVWVGLMNLENMYGTQDSLMSTFQQALQQNEQLPVYYILTNIYQLSYKLDVSLYTCTIIYITILSVLKWLLIIYLY